MRRTRRRKARRTPHGPITEDGRSGRPRRIPEAEWARQGTLSPVPPCPLRAAAKIQNDLRILTERLARVNDNLARKISERNEYDKTIQETEAAYVKVRQAHTPGLTGLACRGL